MKVNLKAKLEAFSETWSPRIVARLNDYDVMVAKAKGDFVWHKHDETDDFFLVVAGRLSIDLRDAQGERSVELEAGELFVVPRGVEHRPRASEEAHILLIEPVGTPSTGNEATAVTKVAL